MRPYPLLLRPLLKPRVWGGRELRRLGRTVPDGETIGESWEVADLPGSVPDGRSEITNGPLAGRSLHDAIAAHGDVVMGGAALTEEGGFPLLVKYLDARRNLSVQVHPTPAYAARHPDALVKNEAWVIIDAAPGAVIYKGLRPGVTRDEFAAHAEAGTVVDDLVVVPVAAGDCHHLPSGTVHALGAGILVAEVQTPSDTTFRVYDWGRTGRTLHIPEALECIDFLAADGEGPPPAQPIQVDRFLTTPLVDAESFGIHRVEVLPADRAQVLNVVMNEGPIIWMVTAGTGRLEGGGARVDLSPGTTVLCPAAMDDGRARLEPGCTLLQVAPPSPLRGMLAEPGTI